jgi:hypothetical protein
LLDQPQGFHFRGAGLRAASGKEPSGRGISLQIVKADVEEETTMSCRTTLRISLKMLAVGWAPMLSIASAGALNGEQLIEQCLANKLMVAGYVAGALDKASVDSDILVRFFFDTYDVHKTAERIEKDNRTLTQSSLTLDGYCIPEVITLEQKASVYCRYLADNPEQRNRNGSELWVAAARVAWPCQ